MSVSSRSAIAKGRHIERVAVLKWIPISLMRVSPLAQRDLNQGRVDKIAAEFDPEQIGIPTVNKRGDFFYVIDGQHRVEVMKKIGWEDQQLHCNTYEGLSEQEEAEMFLKLNDYLAVSGMSKFKIGVTAGRTMETEINAVCKKLGLAVSSNKSQKSIACVGTLKRVYARGGANVLEHALSLVLETYGHSGLSSSVIDGVALMSQRYGTALKRDLFVKRLSASHGGVINLMGKAEIIRRQTGNQISHCVAAAAVDIYNSGRGGTKLANWWVNV